MNTFRFVMLKSNVGNSCRLPLFFRLCCFSALFLSTTGIALAQIDKSSPILFNTSISSIDFSGSGVLPLGPNGVFIATQVNGTRATDHNSSRSNKTSHTPIAGPPGDINPDEEDGRTFDLISTIDVEFDLFFSTSDPSGFAPVLGDTPSAGTISNALLELEAGTTFDFDKDVPGFGILNAKGPTHRGHVTVLKIVFGGGGGDIDLDADGIELTLVPGSDQYTSLANGDLLHSVDFTLDLTGDYAGQAFVLAGLTGTLIEQGQLANNIVPEPTTLVLVIGGLLLGPVVRRR